MPKGKHIIIEKCIFYSNPYILCIVTSTGQTKAIVESFGGIRRDVKHTIMILNTNNVTCTYQELEKKHGILNIEKQSKDSVVIHDFEIRECICFVENYHISKNNNLLIFKDEIAKEKEIYKWESPSYTNCISDEVINIYNIGNKRGILQNFEVSKLDIWAKPIIDFGKKIVGID